MKSKVTQGLFVLVAAIAVGLATSSLSCGSREPAAETESAKTATTHQGLWSAWSEDLTAASSTDSAPSLALNPVDAQHGGMDIFWRSSASGSVGRIASRHWNGTSWGTVTLLPALPNWDDAAGNPVAARSRNQDQVIVVRGNLEYYFSWRTGFGPWAAWVPLGQPPGYGNGPPGMCARVSNGDVYVYVRAQNDNRLWNKFWTQSTGWQNWFNAGGTNLITSSPACVVYDDPNGNIAVAARRWPSQTMGLFTFTGHFLWWVDDLGGAPASAPALSTRGNNRFDVWVRENDNNLKHRWWVQGWGYNGSGWEFGAGFPSGGTFSAPTVVDTGSEQRVAVRGTSSQVFSHTWYDDPIVRPDLDRTIYCDQGDCSVPRFEVASFGTNVCGTAGGMFFSGTSDALGAQNVGRSNFTCLTQNLTNGNPQCRSQNPSCLPAATDGILPSPAGSQFATLVVPSNFGSGDNQLVQFAGSRNRLLMRQAVIVGSHDPCPSPTQDCTSWAIGKGRGAELVYRSTNAQCANNAWDYVTVLDPCRSDWYGGAYCHKESNVPPSNNENSGFDRPELYAPPDAPGKVYMTVIADGNSDSKTLLLSSDNEGSTWTPRLRLPRTAPMLMTGRGSRLYLFACHSIPKIWRVDTNSWTLSGPYTMGSDPCPGSNLEGDWGSESLAFAYNDGSDDYLRVGYSQPWGLGGRAYKINTVKVGPNGLQWMGSVWLTPSTPFGQISRVVAVSADTVDFSTNRRSTPTFYYYYDSMGTMGATYNCDGAQGSIQVKGAIVREVDLLFGPFPLSLEAYGAVRSWDKAPHPGHYLKGGFAFDASEPVYKYKFIAQWTESQSTGIGTNHWNDMHTNIVAVAP